MFDLRHSKSAEVFPDQQSEAVTNSIKIIFKRSEISYNQAQESPRLCKCCKASTATPTLAARQLNYQPPLLNALLGPFFPLHVIIRGSCACFLTYLILVPICCRSPSVLLSDLDRILGAEPHGSLSATVRNSCRLQSCILRPEQQEKEEEMTHPNTIDTVLFKWNFSQIKQR